MTTIKAVVRNGRIELDQPLDLPDGTELLIPVPAAEDRPMTPDEIAHALAAMALIHPFDMTPEEEAEIEAGRQRIKTYTLAHMNDEIEELFP